MSFEPRTNRPGIFRLWEMHPYYIEALLFGLLVTLCYGFTLGLPFFHDDLPIMTWLGRNRWYEVWFSQENGYYRPLAFTIYRLGRSLPLAVQPVVLHGVNFLLLWGSALLLARILRRFGRDEGESLLAGGLLILFPFLNEAIPWITALSHPLVVFLTLLAVYAALRAEEEKLGHLWLLSLGATMLAPLAHESGAICGAIVGGLVLIRGGFRVRWRTWILLALGGFLNVLVVASRRFIPGAQTATQLAGLHDLPQNFFFFLQGLLYPLAPMLSPLIQRGWHDFTVLSVSGGLLALLVLWLIHKSHRWKWSVLALWWWGWGALPAALALQFPALFVGPRLYALSAVGIVALWAGLITELGKRFGHPWLRRGVWLALTGLLVAQSLVYHQRQRALYSMLDNLYDEVLTLVTEEEHPSSGFVNLPAALTWEERLYPLVTEDVVFVPADYSSLSEFVEVNCGWSDVDAVTYGPLFEETEPFWITQGPWVEGEALRNFILDRSSIWLGYFDDADERFLLDFVGYLRPEVAAPEIEPQVRFEDGPLLLRTIIERADADRWRVAFDWYAQGPVNATVFVHVRDGAGNVVAQADGPAMSGLLPPHLWQQGDEIHDVRYIRLPEGTSGPYTIQVGIYNENGRYPAFMGEQRPPDDAAPVGTINTPE